MNVLQISSRQKSRKLDTALLRRIGRHLLDNLIDCPGYELGVHIVAALEMAELNEAFLNHEGSTDVITFNHDETGGDGRLHGEIFICIDDAMAQAAQFRTSWQSEVVRYLAHGVLHLQGHDDMSAGPLRVMKRAENKLVKELERSFDLKKLEKAATQRRPTK